MLHCLLAFSLGKLAPGPGIVMGEVILDFHLVNVPLIGCELTGKVLRSK